MRLGSFVAALALLVFSATRMTAQTCAGLAPFSAGPVRLGAGLSSSEGVKGYGVNMAAGAKAGPYATATLTRIEYSDLDGNGTLVGVGAGYAIDVNPTRTVQFCPRAGLEYISGPDVDTGTGTITTSAHAVSFGGALGGTVPMAPTFDFVPFIAASYIVERATAKFGGVSESDSEDYTEVDVGAGFVINKALTLQPMVAIPVGLDGAKSAFQLAFTFNFGAAKH